MEGSSKIRVYKDNTQEFANIVQQTALSIEIVMYELFTNFKVYAYKYIYPY